MEKRGDLVCFSHLRWDFVFQRPQHLMSRFAKTLRIFFIEEPFFDAGHNYNEIHKQPDADIYRVIPHLHPSFDPIKGQRQLLDSLIESMAIKLDLCWYYSPMALPYSNHLKPKITIYDCMDELSAFKFAPPGLKKNEAALMRRADIVFTGGNSLFEAKKHQHKNIYPFPSSIDKTHFFTARAKKSDPADQKHIPNPRIGFYGVLDERLNLELIRDLASRQPGWHFIFIGPTVKIDPKSLPVMDNIHYLGPKNYDELPVYLSNWDIAFMPFELNESTKYISPTKTPEFLAGGKPVISTSIRDVIYPYREIGLVRIADTADEFVTAIQNELENKNREKWLGKVDHFLSGISWDRTWATMSCLIDETIRYKNGTANQLKNSAYV